MSDRRKNQLKDGDALWTNLFRVMFRAYGYRFSAELSRTSRENYSPIESEDSKNNH